MGPIGATASVFRNYVSMDGRATRAEYWWWGFTYTAICLASTTLSVLSVQPGWPQMVALVNGALLFAFLLATIVPSLTVTVRRLHDTGRSGFWMLITFIPLIGAIWFLILMVLPSEQGENRFGPDPLASDDPGAAPVRRRKEAKPDIYNRTDVSNAYVAAFTTDPRVRKVAKEETAFAGGGISDAELKESAKEFQQQRKDEIKDYYKNRVLGGLKSDEPSYP
ncbi:MAG: DUF805 domain-containing protein [Pseudomonadota bacterium]